MNTDEVEQRYEEQQGTNSPYFQPMIMASEKADLYDKIRPEDVVEAMRYLLMGYEFDKNKQEWVYKPQYRLLALTEIGAYQLGNLLFSVSNKSVSISKLKDNDIRERTRSLVRTAMKMCLRNWKEYGIRSPEQLFFIKEVILSIAFITLKQPEDAGVRTFVQGSHQEQKIIQEQPKKESGMLGGIFRR